MSSNRFSWWWPRHTWASVLLIILLCLAAVTGVVAGPLGAAFNVAFWYGLVIGARFLVLKAAYVHGADITGSDAKPSEPNVSRRSVMRDVGEVAFGGIVMGLMLVAALIVFLLVAWQFGLFDSFSKPR